MSRSLSVQLPHEKTSSRQSEQTEAEAEALFVESERLRDREAFDEANVVLLKAANLGHTGAQVTLGNHFSDGLGVIKSDEKAAYWYKRAYREGAPSGAINLAIDKLGSQNTRGAIFWFEKARLLGSGDATLELAKIFLGKKNGKKKAIRLLEITQQMKFSEISDESKDEARRLLSKMKDPQ